MLRIVTAVVPVILLFLGLTPGVISPVTAADKLSLAPDRVLSFQVEEATWMSLDVAPDGTQMVIEVLGDLYLLPIAGGQAEPLSVGMHFDSQPRFSPDGQSIAFVSDRDGGEEVWLLNLESGEAKKLTTVDNRLEFASPTWSPDSAHVVVSRTSFDLGTFELWAYAVEGGSGTRITKAKAKSDTPRASRHNALGAVYDPSGRYLYYARKLGGFDYNQSLPLWQIARRDLQRGQEDIITLAAGSAFRPGISPDGRYLVYATRYEQQTGLRIRELAGGKDEWLAYPLQRDEQESRFTRDLLPGYAFVPDGSALITTRNGRLVRIELADKSISQIPFTVAIEKAVAQRLDFPHRTGLAPVKARVLADAELSPDGNKIAFASFARIYVHELATGNTVAVSPAGVIAAFPSWSPDNNAIAYVSWDDKGGHIFRVRPRANSKPRQLTKVAAYYSSPAWSRDGSRIVALRGSAHERLARQIASGPPIGADVIWLPSKGGEVHLVIASRGLGRPHFGPEADRIYLHTIRPPAPGKSKAGLISVRYDGTDRRGVLGVSGPGTFINSDDVGARTMQISPDGRHVLFKHASQLYLARLMPFMPAQNVKLDKPQIPLARLTDVGADFSGWSASGDIITWSVGNRFYQRALASVEFADSSVEANGNNKEVDSEADDKDSARAVSPLLEQHAAVEFVEVDLYRPRHKPRGVVALTNATIITMSDAGVIDGGVVVVREDRIEAVGASAEVEIPPEAEIFDLGGKYVLPGFVDTHAHYHVARDLPGTSNASFLANLAYGVTTGMDVQPSTVDILAAQDMVDAGLMLGPRTYSTGPGVFSNNAFKSLEHATAVLRRYKDHYKVHNIKAYISGSRQQRQWLIQAARQLKLMPTAEGFLDMKLDLTHVIDGFSGLEHNYPLPRLYADVVQLTAQAGIAYTPTLLVAYGGPWAENWYYSNESPHDDPKLRRFMPYDALAARTLRRRWFHEREYTFREIAESTRAIVEAGGKVGIGAHGQLQGLGYHWELWAVASGGYDNLQALQLATIGGATMLGMGADLGSLEVGKLADLLVLNENPLEDLRHTTTLEYVMKGGDMYQAETLDQVWPHKKPLPDQWWWHSGPVVGLGE